MGMLAFSRTDIAISVVFSLVALWGIVDAIAKPSPMWSRVNRSKVAWVALLICMPAVSSVLYAATIRQEILNPDKYDA